MEMSSQTPLRQIGLHPWLPLAPLLLLSVQILLLVADLIFDRFYLYLDAHNTMFFFCFVGVLWFACALLRSAKTKLLIFQDSLQWRVGMWGQTQGTIAWNELAEIKIMPVWLGRAEKLLIKTRMGETLVFGPVLKNLQVKQFVDSLQNKDTSVTA